MAQCKVISGLTENTSKNLVFDAGAFFKNFEFGTDTFETAVTEGKLLGATKGGGSFIATPTFREVEIDGMRGAVKGAKLLEAWEISMTANLVEVTAETLSLGLGLSELTDETEKEYKKITGKMCLQDDDYVENITWVGNLSGSEEPVIIQIYNALNTSGLELAAEDKGEAVIATEFTAHFDMSKPNEVPFAIYYPNQKIGV